MEKIIDKKYELIPSADAKGFYRVKALRDFSNVKKGDVGGYVQSEKNLSHYDDCWVYDNAVVFHNAKVFGKAKVYGDATVGGNAKVGGNANVYGYAEICGDAVVESNGDYIVFKNFWSSGRYFTWTKSNNMWRVGCFYGSGEELIKKAYADSEQSGRNYEAFVKFVKSLEKLN